jgi:hypothetical protein
MEGLDKLSKEELIKKVNELDSMMKIAYCVNTNFIGLFGDYVKLLSSIAEMINSFFSFYSTDEQKTNYKALVKQSLDFTDWFIESHKDKFTAEQLEKHYKDIEKEERKLNIYEPSI